MSENRFDDSEVRKAIQHARHDLGNQTAEQREQMVGQAVQQGLEDELSEERAETERVAEGVREQVAREPRGEEARRARTQGLSNVILLIIILLVLLLLAAATGQPNILRISGINGLEALDSRLAEATTTAGDAANQRTNNADSANESSLPGINSANTPTYEVSADFRDYYNNNGGLRMFGLPISPAQQSNGRTYQWFERARLESWPEYAGTPYAIQAGRVGVEFTESLNFPDQAFFVSRAGQRYFAETSHGVSGRFLNFWEQNGGLDRFGYPVSDELQERLPDKQVYTVQYFERARLEYHPELAGTPNEIEVGLLGRGLYLNESKPDIVNLGAPTPVPMQ